MVSWLVGWLVGWGFAFPERLFIQRWLNIY